MSLFRNLAVSSALWQISIILLFRASIPQMRTVFLLPLGITGSLVAGTLRGNLLEPSASTKIKSAILSRT